MHQSKENFRPVIPSILPVCRPGDSSPTICIHCPAPLGVRSTSLGPTCRKDQDLLESIQKFACKMITKSWDKGYDELLYDKLTFSCRQKVVP